MLRLALSGRLHERLGLWMAVLSGLGFALLEWLGLTATLQVLRVSLHELPSLSPAFLLERLLTGGLSAAAFLLVLGGLTTGVSMLFLSDEMSFRVSLPLPHWRLLARQIVLTIATASAPAMLLTIPVAALVAREAGLLAAGTLLAGVVGVLGLAGLLGTSASLLLVWMVPAQRARLLSASLSAIGLAAALVGFRTVRPERALDPIAALELLRSYGETPPGPPGANPAAWVARAFVRTLDGHADGLLSSLALLAVAVIGVFAVARLLAPLHFQLWERSRVAGPGSTSPRSTSRPAVSLDGEVLRAEARTFFRDASTPAQLGSLAAVFVLDLLNVRLLPSGDSASRDLVAGLQTGLALFLVSALALRFAYPSVSSDGRAALVLRTLPLSAARHLAYRYVVRGLPAVVLALILVAASDAVLRPGAAVVATSLAIAFVGGLAIPALHLGLGALFPRYGAANAISVALGPGGLVALTVSTGLSLAATLVVSGELRALAGTLTGIDVSGGFLLGTWSLAVLASGVLPMALARKALQSSDLSVA